MKITLKNRGLGVQKTLIDLSPIFGFGRGLVSTLILVVVANFVTGCAKSSTSEPAVATVAPKDIGQSLRPANSDSSVVGQNSVVLQKSALGAAFLLRAQIKQDINTSTWQDLRPLVVTFQQSGDELALKAVNALASYGSNIIDSSKLVATFKILSQDDQSITFSWSGGFQTLFDAPYDSPEDSSVLSNQQQGNSQAIQTVKSFIEVAELTALNQFHVREDNQIIVQALRAQTDAEAAVAPSPVPVLDSEMQSVVVDYRIEPYLPHSHFQKKNADPFKKFGFFTVSVGLESLSNSAQPLAAHWDLDPDLGPITYKISKNFPPSLVQAVAEGVQYWNLVLGAGSVQVITNADPEADFAPRTVMINWLPWTDAAASWADMEIDPLTGELVNGQIYITSVFLQLSPRYPYAPIAPSGSIPASLAGPQKRSLSLFGLPSAEACRFPAEAVVKSAGLIQSQTDSALPYSLFVTDEIRHVVAHEVGHTLGLRHNFAGSFDTPLSSDQINAEKLKYSTVATHEGAEVTTSIMDYIGGLEQGLTGRYILNHALKYDQAALAWVQDPKLSSKSSVLKFCTDDDTQNKTVKDQPVSYGCFRFDAANNPFNLGVFELKRTLGTTVQRKFLDLVQQIQTGASSNTPFEAVLDSDFRATQGILDAAQFPANNFKTLWNFLATTLPNSQDNKIQGLDALAPKSWNAPALVDPTDAITRDIKAYGGLSGLIKTFLPMDSNGNLDVNFYQSQLQALRSSPVFTSGKTAQGMSYNLTVDQQSQLRAYLQNGVNLTLARVVATMYVNFADTSFVLGPMIDADQQNDFAVLNSQLFNWSNGTQPVSVQNQVILVSKPVLSKTLRGVVALSLSPTHYSSPSPSVVSHFIELVRPKMEAEIQSVLKALTLTSTDPALPELGASTANYSAFILKVVPSGQLSQAAIAWLTEQVQLLKVLDVLKAPANSTSDSGSDSSNVSAPHVKALLNEFLQEQGLKP